MCGLRVRKRVGEMGGGVVCTIAAEPPALPCPKVCHTYLAHPTRKRPASAGRSWVGGAGAGRQFCRPPAAPRHVVRCLRAYPPCSMSAGPVLVFECADMSLKSYMQRRQRIVTASVAYQVAMQTARGRPCSVSFGSGTRVAPMYIRTYVPMPHRSRHLRVGIPPLSLHRPPRLET
jgi:hypothetical protein